MSKGYFLCRSRMLRRKVMHPRFWISRTQGRYGYQRVPLVFVAGGLCLGDEINIGLAAANTPSAFESVKRSGHPLVVIIFGIIWQIGRLNGNTGSEISRKEGRVEFDASNGAAIRQAYDAPVVTRLSTASTLPSIHDLSLRTVGVRIVRGILSQQQIVGYGKEFVRRENHASSQIRIRQVGTIERVPRLVRGRRISLGLVGCHSDSLVVVVACLLCSLSSTTRGRFDCCDERM
mmetsp:Transcript_13945/g.26673  ORF Transcript_13945/g.26673 Transcript_13945/m.26673 type:complete len:233 (+) Transcript_13945:1121-1819(+)